MDQKLFAKDIMTRDPITAGVEEEINEVAKKLAKNRIHGVPVLEDGKISGIITETDFFTKSLDDELYLPSYISFLKSLELSGKEDLEKKEEIKKLINSKAKDIMTSPCITVLPDTKIGDVIDFIKTKKLTTLPVADEENKPLGIITTHDIIKLI